jgi:hypothetical protein
MIDIASRRDGDPLLEARLGPTLGLGTSQACTNRLA